MEAPGNSAAEGRYVPRVGIIGAGTMGGGIAQLACTGGWEVRLTDADPAAVQRAVQRIASQLDRLVEKGRLTSAERAAALERLRPEATTALGDCDLIIEAVAEDLEVKARVMATAARSAGPDAILASNTSSLSISALANAVDRSLRTPGAAGGQAGESARAGKVEGPGGAATDSVAARLVGMHFFNPAPLMPLVEIVAGRQTAPAVIGRAEQIARSWGRTPVRVRDTPGFIVNRVARGYYLESLRMLGEGVGGVSEIDHTLRTLGGFRMGPFELMDLIGIDVNYSVSVSIWEQMGRAARFEPHPIQRRLVESGRLGRKTGSGFYAYEASVPVPAVPVERRSFEVPPRLYEALRRFTDGATVAAGSVTEQYVLARVLATVINEAAHAVDEQIAAPDDIDTAMRLGAGYPQGPLTWAERIGRHTCAALLRALNEQVADGRFAPAHWLMP